VRAKVVPEKGGATEKELSPDEKATRSQRKNTSASSQLNKLTVGLLSLEASRL
jgi:hypothetical protein